VGTRTAGCVVVLLLALLPAAARTATLERTLLIDEAGTLDLAAARAADADFTPLGEGAANLGHTDAVVWLRARPRDLRPDATWLLVLSHPVIDLLDVDVVRGDGDVVHHQMGDLRPYGRRPYRHRNFVVPVPPDTDAVYFRIRSQGTLTLPLRLTTEAALRDEDNAELALFGFYFGVLIAMAAYNACIYVVVRDRSYVFYVIYVTAFGALQALLNGFAAPLLPLAGLDANQWLLLLYAAVIACGMLFVQHFLDTRRLLPRWHQVTLAIALLATAAGLAGLVLPYAWMLQVLLGLGGAVLVLILIMLPLAIRRGSGPARYLVAAFACLLPGCALFVLRAEGLVPHNLLTQHGLELSTALETVVLSFALANRINVWRAEAAAAELAVARAHARYSRQLARRMEEDRRRVAAELHDSIGQSLLVLANGLKRALAGTASRERLADMAALARQSVADVRAVAQDLHPAQLERLGLADAVRAMLNRVFADAPAALHLEVDIDGLSPHPMRDVQLYRIAQEAASNVVRHAGARHCWVRLAREGGGVTLIVEDDGRGINGNEGTGLGLATQAERAALIGADYVLGSRPGGGTRLAVRAPEEPTP
jgi:signal transduction histidine kinase